MKKYLLLISVLIFLFSMQDETLARCISGDCINGTGTNIYPSGSRYTGEFKEGKEHGKGILYFFNGSSYEGEFINGEFNGKGKLRYSNGNEYTGQFQDGKISGEGEFIPPAEKEEVKSIYAILPEKTEVLFTVPSISDIYRHFSIRSNTIFGNPINNTAELKKDTGINPLSIWDLKSIGIDTTKETGFFLSDIKMIKDKKPEMNVFFYIPVSDYKLFMLRVKDAINKKSKKISFTENEGYTVMEKVGEKEKIYMINIKDYVLIGTNTNGNAVPLIKQIISGKKNLLNSRKYSSFSSRYKSNGKIYGYADLQEIIKNNIGAIKRLFESTYKKNDKSSLEKTLDVYRDYRSAAFTMDLDNNNFNMNIYYLLRPEAKTLSLFRGIIFNRSSVLGISKDPILLAIIGFNPEKYYKYLKSMLPGLITKSLKDKINGIKKDYNVDVEKEIIPNLGGNFNLGFYDGKSINMFNYNALLSATVKNRNAIANVMKKMTKSMPKQMVKTEKIGGITANIYNMGILQLYSGFKGNQLLISPSRSIFEESLNPKKSAGFINRISDKMLKDSMKKDISMLYVNVDEAILAAKSFAPMSKWNSPGFEEQVRKFVYLLFSSNVRRNYVSGGMFIKTRFEDPFFIGLKKVVEEAKRLKAQKDKIKEENKGMVPYQKSE